MTTPPTPARPKIWSMNEARDYLVWVMMSEGYKIVEAMREAGIVLRHWHCPDLPSHEECDRLMWHYRVHNRTAQGVKS